MALVATLALMLRARGGSISSPPKVTDADQAEYALKMLWAWWSSPTPLKLAPKPDPGPQRSVPCIDIYNLALVVAGRDPVVCSRTMCRRLNAGDNPVIARPPAVEPLPLDLVARASARGWSVCDGGRCTALGPRVTAAIARDPQDSAEATLDRRVVVVRNQVFDVASDRPIRMPPAEIGLYDPDRYVAGNMILEVPSSNEGGMVQSSRLVDRRGKPLGWVYADGSELRVGDKYLVFVSRDMGVIDVRDARTGARLVELGRYQAFSDVLNAVALDDHTFALIREAGDGVMIESVELADTDVQVSFAAYLPHCDR
jgi:hypothetical protein